MTSKNDLPKSPEVPATALKEVKPQPVEGVVKLCESLLEQAKSGELRGLVWAAAWQGDLVSSGWHLGPNLNFLRMGYELESCKLQWYFLNDDELRDIVKETY